MIGPRSGPTTTVRRLVARAMARTLGAYVVPDARTARDAGLDLRAAGLEIAVTPRHASVLLVVGELPAGLRAAAAIVYAQMPRPRSLLALGSGTTTPVPPADVVVALDQTGLEEGLARVRELVASHAWSETTAPFTAEMLAGAAENDGGMDHGHGGHAGHTMTGEDYAGHSAHAASHDDQSGHDDHGNHVSHVDHGSYDDMEDPEGSSSGPHERHGEYHDGMDHMDHGDPISMGYSRHTHSPDDAHEDMEHGDHTGMDHGDSAGMNHATMGDDMSGHDHHMMGGGFMSMVAMTKDLPRSRDGLPMEWTETAFGPLFSGLPAGIAAMLTLDGDTVAAATLDTGHVHRGIAASLPGPAGSLPDRLAALDPLAPLTYRVLAAKALAVTEGSGASDALDRSSVGALERERVASHLAWLAGFLDLLDVGRLSDRAARLHLDVGQAPDIASVLSLRPRIERLTRALARTPLLSRRITDIGRLDPEALQNASGPVARACGRSVDARAGIPAYRALGFEPTTRNTGDVHARLHARLSEICQSLDLIAASGTIALALPEVSAHLTGSGMAIIETPRGAARLHLVVHLGEIHEVHLATPSHALMDLVPVVTEQVELADALVCIASLDLSPWEIDR